MTDTDEQGIVWDATSAPDLHAQKVPSLDDHDPGAPMDRPHAVIERCCSPGHSAATLDSRNLAPPAVEAEAPKRHKIDASHHAPENVDMTSQKPLTPAVEGQTDSRILEAPTHMDAGTVMRYALEHLKQIFGDRWAEKAALRELQFKKLDSRLQTLNKDLATANQQVKERDKEIRQIRLAIQGIQKEKDSLEHKERQLAKELVEAREGKNRLENHLHQTELSARQGVLSLAEQAFGATSELCKFVNDLSPEMTERIGYACVFSLPRTNLEAGLEGATISIHAIVTMANKFLENVKDFDRPERSSLLNIVADHLSRVSQLFTFRNEEGQLFNPDRHSVRSAHSQSPGGKVTRITTFYVGNNKTKQPLHKAEVFV